MTWVEEYRRKVGMNRREFAAAVTAKLGGRGDRRVVVTPAILTIIEEWPNARTHPRIMNVIARACGATKEQRDQFLHPSRRDYPYAEAVAAVTVKDGAAHPWREKPGATSHAAKMSAVRHMGAMARKMQAREIVIVNRDGMEVQRVAGLEAAGEVLGISGECAADRCYERTRVEFTAKRRLTCRFADAWDAMSQDMRQQQMRIAVARSEENDTKRIVVIDREGNVRARYDSAKECARADYVTPAKVYDRCKRKTADEWCLDNEVTYRYALEWDKMTRAEQLRDIGAAL